MNAQARAIKSAVMARRRQGLAGDYPADLVVQATAYVREELATGATLGDLAWQLGIRAVTLSEWLGSTWAPAEPVLEQVADASEVRSSPPGPPVVPEASLAAEAAGPTEASRPRASTTAHAGLALVLGRVVGPVVAAWQAARRTRPASAGGFPAGTGTRGPPRELPSTRGRARGEAVGT
jgi:hypothetical protein